MCVVEVCVQSPHSWTENFETVRAAGEYGEYACV